MYFQQVQQGARPGARGQLPSLATSMQGQGHGGNCPLWLRRCKARGTGATALSGYVDARPVAGQQ